MYNKKSFLCVIPARGESKGLPHKNIKNLAGKPMIYWAIKAAKDSKVFDRIVVSSESWDIGGIVAKYGVVVSHRPDNLATDKSPVADTIQQVIKSQTRQYDYVQLLQPTSPLVCDWHIRAAADMLIDKQADMVISVCRVKPHIGLAAPLGKDLSMKGFYPKNLRNKNREDIPPTYHLNGAIYMGKYDIFAEKKDYYEQNTYAYVMDEKYSVDVDDETDFMVADSELRGRSWYGRTFK